MHSSKIDPFVTDHTVEYDVRKLVEMDYEEAERLMAKLTIARIQVAEYLKAKEEEMKAVFSLKEDF